MLHSTQQLWIDLVAQSRERHGVNAIILPPALSDQSHAARVRHDGLMTELTEQSAHPRRMRSGLHCDTTSEASLREISLMALGVVLTFCSSSTSPVPSSTQ